ncbi:MAG: PaaI family thioesterase [Clostridia bacterium]
MKLCDMLGVQVVESAADRHVLHTPVTEAMLQPQGILHGGISAYLAEHAASEGVSAYCDAATQQGVGLDLTTTHLLPVFEGDTIETVATPIRNGGRVRVWKIEQFRLSDGEKFNVSQITMYMKKPH